MDTAMDKDSIQEPLPAHIYENGKELCVAQVIKNADNKKLSQKSKPETVNIKDGLDITRFILRDTGAFFVGDQPGHFVDFAHSIKESTQKIAGAGEYFGYFVGKCGSQNNVLFEVKQTGAIESKGTIFDVSGIRYMGRVGDAYAISFVSNISNEENMYAVACFNERRGLTVYQSNIFKEDVLDIFYSDGFAKAVESSAEAFRVAASKLSSMGVREFL